MKEVKKMLRDRSIEIDIDGDTIKEVIDRLMKHQVDLTAHGVDEIRIDLDRDYRYPRLTYRTLETDTEYEQRIENDKVREHREREELKRLKDKYE